MYTSWKGQESSCVKVPLCIKYKNSATGEKLGWQEAGLEVTAVIRGKLRRTENKARTDYLLL